MTIEDRIRALPIWQQRVAPAPLGGGITNVNYLVRDGDQRFVVRIGNDIPVHQVMRFNERAASEAAFVAGISPEVVHAEPGVLVIRYIASTTLRPEDLRENRNLGRIVALIRRVHTEMPRVLRGPALMFWVFHVVRDYGHTLTAAGSRHLPALRGLLAAAETLEREVGPVDIVYAHNDLLAGNILDDGKRLWLIDWDYAGFNTPLFDLANLASNNGFSETQEEAMLLAYFGTPTDPGLQQRYSAMKCASLLRETLWSMVSEIHSKLDFDYQSYTADYRGRFDRALAGHRARWPA